MPFVDDHIHYFTLSFDDFTYDYYTWSHVFTHLQGLSKVDNWGGGGGDIRIFVFTHHKNNRFRKKLIVRYTNIWISAPPPIIKLATALHLAPLFFLVLIYFQYYYTVLAWGVKVNNWENFKKIKSGCWGDAIPVGLGVCMPLSPRNPGCKYLYGVKQF